MASELIFYTNPMSRGRIVRWILEEVGAPYRTEILTYGPEMQSPEYLAINPMGKIPSLKHGEVIISETAAICAYLADAFPQANLAPASTSPQRGAYYRWLFFAAGPLESAITNKALNVEVPAERQGFVGYRNFNAAMDMLDYAVAQNPYLTGNQFTAADIYLGSQIGFGLRFGSLEKRPAFETYWARISDRPAYRRASEIDDALMPAPAA